MTSMNKQLRNELRLMLDKAQSIISSHHLANSNSTSQSSMPDLLSGLPIEQQISIYKNSVTALRSRIDALTFLLQRENEIRTKKEVLYTVEGRMTCRLVNKESQNLLNLVISLRDL